MFSLTDAPLTDQDGNKSECRKKRLGLLKIESYKAGYKSRLVFMMSSPTEFVDRDNGHNEMLQSVLHTKAQN